MTDGYPDEDELKRIRDWPAQDVHGLMAYVKERWQYADSGYWSEETVPDDYFEGRSVRKYLVSTVGWSGNELLMNALQGNVMFWMLAWYSSRRGGHCEFRFRVGP